MMKTDGNISFLSVKRRGIFEIIRRTSDTARHSAVVLMSDKKTTEKMSEMKEIIFALGSNR
ncbi:hypothetical protein DRN79_03640 [Methanosarcinales archaeon]|nr:MAG: hypothetical protein DRN79_03640 [Methanosarcinales archaeon]